MLWFANYIGQVFYNFKRGLDGMSYRRKEKTNG